MSGFGLPLPSRHWLDMFRFAQNDSFAYLVGSKQSAKPME
jgi:hypothetical protein